MAAKSLILTLLSLSFINASMSLGMDFLTEEGNTDSVSDSLMEEGQERLLLVLGGNGGLNLTTLAALAALAAAAALPLLGLAALGLLLWAVLSQQSKDSGYGGTGYSGGHHSSYSSSYRSFDVADTDWESLSILDWIALAEDTYSKYEATNPECQKRVICELFQNAEALGRPAQTFIKYFSYLSYADVFSVPENVKQITDGLLDAAERGRNLKKDCDEVYLCPFSIKDILHKYGHGRFIFNEENKIH